jgi:hypothetical protein
MRESKQYTWIVGVYIVQLALILICFRMHWKMLLIATIPFLISLFIKSNRLAKLVSMLSLLLILIPTLYFRVPKSGTKQVIESSIRYQLLDFGQGDMNRCLFEVIVNNRRVFLVDSSTRWLYVDNKLRKQLWPESPWAMKAKNYSIRARFTCYDLLFGGHSVARVDSIWQVNEAPAISK